MENDNSRIITGVKKVIVEQFGDVDQLKIVNCPTPVPDRDEVVVRLTSIGMNHADLMARRGDYKISSGDPPFTPGLEGGGVIEAVGEAVDTRHIGDRVLLSPGIPRPATGERWGTYRSHFVCSAELTIPAPDEVSDEQLGAIWLPFFTAWGCLMWRQKIKAGDYIAMPAASSSVALAAAQIARRAGATTIGLTTREEKIAVLRSMPHAHYDHLLLTRDDTWHRELRALTGGMGINVFFDPVGAGAYLNREIRSLAKGATIWVYGLLGKMDVVDVSPLIIKDAAIRGWLLNHYIEMGDSVYMPGCHAILDGFACGDFSLPIAETFALGDVRKAHQVMAKGKHIGKLVLIP